MQFNLLCGDAIEKLRTLQDNSINTCVTSPPYYGLRDHGVGNYIGVDLNPEYLEITKRRVENERDY